MAVAMEFKIGNTNVRIMDDYCKDKTPEEVQKILDRIAFNAQRDIAAAEAAKRQNT